MPAMVRPKGENAKIAYKILGVPANLDEKKPSKSQRYVNRRLVREETRRIR